MANYNPVALHLDTNNMGIGPMLEEVVRASLYHSNPSALVNHILIGVVKHREQTDIAASVPDRKVMGELEVNLRHLYDILRRAEDEAYPPPEPL